MNIFNNTQEQTKGEDDEPPLPSVRDFNDWHWQINNSITTIEGLEKVITLTDEERQSGNLPLRITPHYARLLSEPAIRKCVVPTARELNKSAGESEDPLKEENYSKLPNLIHKYPSKVLFLVSDICSTYCRYCTRSRVVGRNSICGNKEGWGAAIEYIERTPTIKDVLFSGGDPLMLSNENLDYLLSRIQNIKHVLTKRIGTKVPVVLPQRITPELLKVLKKHHPLFMSIHFTHPAELTPETKRACNMLADAGIPLRSQTVLLKDVNDNVSILRELFEQLLTIRVSPYLLYRMDDIIGGSHFRTTIAKGIEIIKGLRGITSSGYCVPQFIVDSPGGKIPVSPNTITKTKEGYYFLANYKGEIYQYAI